MRPLASLSLEKPTPQFEDPRLHLTSSCGRHFSKLVLRQRAVLCGRNATAASSGSFRTAVADGGAAWDGSALLGGLLELLAEQAGGELVRVNGMGRLLRVGREIK